MPKWTEKAHEAQTYTKNSRQLMNAGAGEIVFPREEHTSWLSNTEWSALKTYIVTLYRRADYI